MCRGQKTPVHFFIMPYHVRKGKSHKIASRLAPFPFPQRGKAHLRNTLHFPITDALALRATTQKLSFCIIRRMSSRFAFQGLSLRDGELLGEKSRMTYAIFHLTKCFKFLRNSASGNRLARLCST